MDSLQARSIGASLLLGVVVLLTSTCVSEGSVRPATVAEIREVLVLGTERNIRKEIEDGIMLPPLPQYNDDEEESLRKSVNLLPPVPDRQPVIGNIFFIPFAKLIPNEDKTDQDSDVPSMSYVNSSQFRKSFLNSEDNQSETVMPAKKVTGTKIHSEKILKPNKQSENKVPKKFEHDNSGSDTSKLPEKTYTDVPATSKSVKESKEEAPIPSPPIWSHDGISDEISDPFGRLPSNEEYDRIGRFTHSILHGYNTGF